VLFLDCLPIDVIIIELYYLANFNLRIDLDRQISDKVELLYEVLKLSQFLVALFIFEFLAFIAGNLAVPCNCGEGISKSICEPSSSRANGARITELIG
jgi:hypothetical protein